MEDREGHGCGFPHDTALTDEADRWAKLGERSFWSWYQTLTRDDQRIVEHHMNRRD